MTAESVGLDRPGSSFMSVVGLGDTALPTVTIELALTVPAVWAAVSFLSRTLAALPLHGYRRTQKGSEKINGGLQTLVHAAPNPEWTSLKLRQYFWQQVFTEGRGLLWIERSGSAIVGFWPMNPRNVTVCRDDLQRTTYKVGAKLYDASEVIDVPFMLKDNGLGHFGPISQGAKAIQLAIAMNDYGANFFAGGGVPPLAVYGPVASSAEAINRATADIARSIDTAKRARTSIVSMPSGHELKPIGFDPEKGQMTDARRMQVEEIARLYNLPPVFLQDLSRATFSNAEQQDLHLVKHLIGQWAAALEQEMNLKLFGQRNSGRYVEHNLDGLLRGDFKTRMEGLAKGIQNALLTPNEARALENRPEHDKGNDLLIQGATVPLGAQPPTNMPPPSNGDDGL